MLNEALRLYAQFFKENYTLGSRLEFGLDRGTLFMVWTIPDRVLFTGSTRSLSRDTRDWFALRGLEITSIGLPDSIWGRLEPMSFYYWPVLEAPILVDIIDD